jgi:hypothetical protein
MQDSTQSGNNWVEIKPGLSMNNLTTGQVTGDTSTTQTGLLPDGVHNDSQITGGITNGLATQSDKLEALVKSVRESADTYIDLSKKYNISAPDVSQFGSVNDPKIVYATGNVGTNGQVTESNLQFSGSFTGAGLLVIEINNPNLAGLILSGQSKWTGLILIVSNVASSGPKTMLETVGGGSDIHVVGGAILFSRNKVDPSNPSANLLGHAFTKLSGQADIHWSRLGLNKAHEVMPSAMQVRSWRRVPEGQ